MGSEKSGDFLSVEVKARSRRSSSIHEVGLAQELKLRLSRRKAMAYYANRSVKRNARKPIEKFQWAARVVHVLVSSCMRWRRYKKTNEKPTTSLTRAPTKRKPSGIGFDSKTFKEKSKISEDIRAILTTVPRRRTLEQLKKVQRLCRTTRAFNIFPLEREMDLARYVAYERYDNARVVACQDRLPERFYYVLSGRISKVCLYNLAAGVTKMSFGELMQGATTDPREIQENIPREHSLICKGSVEVLVLDREDFMDLMTTSPDQGLPTDFLRSIELFRSFPMEKFKEEMDSITTKYFARDSVIVKDSSDSPYFFILKSGRCKVVRQQDVLDVSKASKLPRIPMASKPPTRATPGKNPTSLLEFTKCHTACSKESFILDKLRANKAEREQGRVTEEGIITDTPSPEAAPLPPIKRKHDYTKELQGPCYEADIFKRTSEMDLVRKATMEAMQPTKRSSDMTNTVPTRKALLQIAVLKPGDMFSLESMMPKVANKISAEIIHDTPDPSASVTLISEGAECVMINKRFFLQYAPTTTLIQFKALREQYTSVEQARKEIRNQQAWNLYKSDMVRTLAGRNRKQRR
ncbi:uncharacterized protein LOC5512175 isoform X2 [Nematostella vectensis]|uniref:uncharacterized protein LOC5512175 isoform X2 n=2 Tax=Nematostella vectensis TaxID=45351 RepID=UPI0020770F83|nr:uncharacterized protein LOC5512175 isoform X2 [Nematostella vectensis]